MLEGKTIVLGVTGSIAAYKIANLTSMLVKLHADVHVLMTQNATNFINPITFETLTGHKCLVDTFDRNFNYNIEHVALGNKADVVLVAPATANIIAKMANGLADDMLSTTVLACHCNKIVAPAMNTNMYDNPITQQNLQSLRSLGMQIVEPVSGLLACGDTGRGKMADIDIIEEAVEMALHGDKPLAGRRVLVTAGPTQEAMDPVRYITNHSSGKMGYEVARAARNLGAEVTLVSGQCGLKPPYGMETVSVVSAEDMYEAVTSRAADCDYIVMAAAVADYTPAVTAEDKIKKKDDDMSVALKRTHDILKTLGERKSRAQVLCGFAMETQNLLENARKKLEAKNADMIVANNLKVEGAGFAHDTNVATFLLRDGLVENPLQSKETLAYAIWNQLIEIRAQKGID
ncbi:MAG: bifunctional phosphopantothenoylcysteine decarboxylase/phosphopantothenate--cysteine ligase CoaBC [Eubacterium sp.]|nr:bifunctional phosphopantothenoylcysteine decarboxylase/phosphopantothenate--cysteine ligase CoaBC [Eubacterium sp.]